MQYIVHYTPSLQKSISSSVCCGCLFILVLYIFYRLCEPLLAHLFNDNAQKQQLFKLCTKMPTDRIEKLSINNLLAKCIYGISHVIKYKNIMKHVFAVPCKWRSLERVGNNREN